MEFKTQTNRSTKQNKATNICVHLEGLNLGVCSSEYWGNFRMREEPLIELNDKRMSLTEFKYMVEMFDNYKRAYELFLEYWDSLPDEEKPKLHKKLRRLKL